MATSFYNLSTFSRFNLSASESDIHVFVKEYKERIKKQLAREEEGGKTPFISYAEERLSVTDVTWLQDNQERFFKDTKNQWLLKRDFLSECGFICCMIYSEDGEHIIVGHSSGLIQSSRPRQNMDEQKQILAKYIESIRYYYKSEQLPKIWYPMFYEGTLKKPDDLSWVRENYDMFIKGTPNKVVYNRWFFSEMGAITALEYSPNGLHVIVGHSSGLIQMRHGSTGTVMCTLRNIQFPPKPVYAIEYSKIEERVCYAACMDGAVYRIEIPHLTASVDDPPAYCIRADPALECLNMQFYGTPGTSSHATPFITQRSPALSLGLTADQTKMVVGYEDASIKVYDIETQEPDISYKVHKLRLQFIPKKLQRMHFGQVCALKCHSQKPYMFASGAWDNTLRIWDVRCKVGCVMTFEGVNICNDSIDLNRDHCIAGSWKTTGALTVWDLVARKRLNIIRVQNRRPNVDGEYIYACRYWHSADFNRKGKYAIIGGSGTNSVEVINLHNRYITCSYPASGTVLAVASHQDRIAFGGTATAFVLVNFYDPKHERVKYKKEEEPDFDYANAVSIFDDSDDDFYSHSTETLPVDISHSRSVAVTTPSKMSRTM